MCRDELDVQASGGDVGALRRDARALPTALSALRLASVPLFLLMAPGITDSLDENIAREIPWRLALAFPVACALTWWGVGLFRVSVGSDGLDVVGASCGRGGLRVD